MPEKKKENRGGARRVVDPAKGRSKKHWINLYDHEKEYLVAKYGSLTAAIRSVVDISVK